MAYVTLSSKAIGSTIKLKVNGSAKDFIVVHQGKPSSVYDDSCNGTWLLMKDIYESRAWHSSNTNDYANSTIHSYLNGTFLNLFESNIKNAIKQVKLPYRKGSGTSTTVTSGSELQQQLQQRPVRQLQWRLVPQPLLQLGRYPPRFDFALYSLGV